MTKKTKKTNWKKMYEQMKCIAGDAIYLADAYSGGESENANQLNKQFEEIEDKEK